MTRNRPAHQDIVLLREDLHHLQALHLHAIATKTARHADTLHNAARVRRVTQRTRSALTVVLTVSSLTDTAEPVTLDNTLKTFTLRCAHDLHLLTFGENVY